MDMHRIPQSQAPNWKEFWLHRKETQLLPLAALRSGCVTLSKALCLPQKHLCFFQLC